MKNSLLMSLFSVIVLSLSPNVAVNAAEPTTELAKHLLELSGRRAGICSMPRCGDGALAAALAKESQLLVQALNEKPEQVIAMRKLVEDAGLLGRTVYVEQGSAAKNPLADWGADLVVIADAADSDLASLSAKDIRRVCAPYRGVIIVGRAKTLGAGLTKDKLEAWAKGLEAASVKIVEDESGLWAVATMPPLAGGDDWGHWACGPDQNRYSPNEALKWPYLIQWTAKPYWDGKFDIFVAAGGREFRVNTTTNDDYVFKTPTLTARSLYNGQVLWKRPVSGDFGPTGSLLVASADTVYLKDGNGVVCLDPETGQERRRIALTPDPEKDCRWLLLSDGVLVGVLGRKPQVEAGKNLIQTIADFVKKNKGALSDHAAAQMWFVEYDQGDQIVGFDAASGRQLWRREEKKIDPAKTVLAAGRVFLYAGNDHALCLDLKTGQEKWKTSAPVTDMKPTKGNLGWHITETVTVRLQAIATADFYLVASQESYQEQCFAAADGKLWWEKAHGLTNLDQNLRSGIGIPGGSRLVYPVVVDGKIVTNTRGSAQKEGEKKPVSGNVWDPLTGNVTGESINVGGLGSCGPFNATKYGFHGGGGTFLDRYTNERVTQTVKSACVSGTIPADGVLLTGHGNCQGCFEWVGGVAFRAADGFPMHQAPPGEERLTIGKNAPVPTGEASPLDWATYRHDVARSSAAAVNVPEKAAVAWTWTPTPPYASEPAVWDDQPDNQSTPAICVDDKVIFGAADGLIRCLERKSGKELWNYPTAGQIISSPTFDHGRIYAGSGDGCVYCLDANDGALVWRFRVAPADQRIMVYGHLLSRWPVLPNVLVHEGVAYVAAGLIGATGGTHVVALDTRSGKLLWEKSDLGLGLSACSKEPVKTGDLEDTYDATGQLAFSNGKLWLFAGDRGPLSFDPQTGAASPFPFPEGAPERVKKNSRNAQFFRWRLMGRGQDIGIINGRTLVCGGHQIFNNQWNKEQPAGITKFAITDGSVPAEVMPVTTLNLDGMSGTFPNCCTNFPAWDGEQAVLHGWLHGSFMVRLVHGLDRLIAEAVRQNQPTKDGFMAQAVKSIPTSQPDVSQAWERKIGGTLRAMALAKNAVVLTRFLSGKPQRNFVGAYRRKEGELLWECEVPGFLTYNGLSIGPAGDVVVTLLDGRVVCVGAKE